jgi:thiol-disulfide isomerase/thioredoxin
LAAALYIVQVVPGKGVLMKLRLSVLIFLLPIVFNNGCSSLGGTKVYKNPDYSAADLGYLQIGMPAIPNLPAEDWLNATPGIVDSLQGKVVLFDFWDYTCVNCVRTLPYLKEWYKRYAKDGLVIIGVHSPEFQFAKTRENLEAAVVKFGLEYPVVMDNGFKLWTEFGNNSWPEEYLFDGNGVLRYNHVGEGEYGNTESMIQKLLKASDPELSFTPVMRPLRPTDAPGAVCYLPTGETYLGYKSGKIGNEEGYSDNHLVDYSAPKSIAKDRFYLVGKWEIRAQYVRYAGDPGKGKLMMNYAASSVNLVIQPDSSGLAHPGQHDPFRVYVYRDGLPVPEGDRPSGMQLDDSGRTYFTMTNPGMYDIIDGRKYGRHLLTLEPSSDTFAAYSFTFGTVCDTTGS